MSLKSLKFIRFIRMNKVIYLTFFHVTFAKTEIMNGISYSYYVIIVPFINGTHKHV